MARPEREDGREQQEQAGREHRGLADEHADEHEASVNQVRHEPVPASHHDDRRPEAVRRNEEAAASSAGERPRPTDAGGASPRDEDDPKG
jgi:hypothetical protein